MAGSFVIHTEMLGMRYYWRFIIQDARNNLIKSFNKIELSASEKCAPAVHDVVQIEI